MTTFNHAYDIAFSITSKHPQGEDLTAPQLRGALSERLARLTDDELLEAIGGPFDTYEEN